METVAVKSFYKRTTPQPLPPALSSVVRLQKINKENVQLLAVKRKKSLLIKRHSSAERRVKTVERKHTRTVKDGRNKSTPVGHGQSQLVFQKSETVNDDCDGIKRFFRHGRDRTRVTSIGGRSFKLSVPPALQSCNNDGNNKEVDALKKDKSSSQMESNNDTFDISALKKDKSSSQVENNNDTFDTNALKNDQDSMEWKNFAESIPVSKGRFNIIALSHTGFTFYLLYLGVCR